MKSRIAGALVLAVAVLSFGSCVPAAKDGKKRIVVTHSVLASVVRDLVGDAFAVVALIPDGMDPHEWEPSARDMETMDGAALIVENGLALEEGMKGALSQARKSGVRTFTASDHVVARRVGKGEGLPSGDADQAAGARDPHLWTDPVAMKAVVDALAAEIHADFGLDLSVRRDSLDSRLSALDAEVSGLVAKLPLERRVLVTGHESLGYFAARYGFKLVGAVLPSLSSQAETSAAELAALKALILSNRVSAIFTEVGTSPKVALSLAGDAKVKAVPLAMHSLPQGGGYEDYLRRLATTITGALSP